SYDYRLCVVLFIFCASRSFMSRSQFSGLHRDLHSFPTRRSSDLSPGIPTGSGPWKNTRTPPSHFPCTARTWTRGSREISPCPSRSEEHTSELQSRFDLVCRLLLEKRKQTSTDTQFKKGMTHHYKY